MTGGDDSILGQNDRRTADSRRRHGERPVLRKAEHGDRSACLPPGQRKRTQSEVADAEDGNVVAAIEGDYVRGQATAGLQLHDRVVLSRHDVRSGHDEVGPGDPARSLHTDAAGRQAIERIWTIGLLRIDEGVDRGTLGSHLMMVGDDQPHSGRPTTRDLDGVGPAIAGDYQAGPARMQLVQRLQVEAVALGETIGDVGDDIRTNRAQTARQRDACRDAVGVVVAVDGNTLALMDGARDQVARDRHVLQEEGIGCPLEIRLEPGGELRLACDPPGVQHLAEHR